MTFAMVRSLWTANDLNLFLSARKKKDTWKGQIYIQQDNSFSGLLSQGLANHLKLSIMSSRFNSLVITSFIIKRKMFVGRKQNILMPCEMLGKPSGKLSLPKNKIWKFEIFLWLKTHTFYFNKGMEIVILSSGILQSFSLVENCEFSQQSRNLFIAFPIGFLYCFF